MKQEFCLLYYVEGKAELRPQKKRWRVDDKTNEWKEINKLVIF